MLGYGLFLDTFIGLFDSSVKVLDASETVIKKQQSGHVILTVIS